jgi:tetratricopeptide (TPR) repeat protein
MNYRTKTRMTIKGPFRILGALVAAACVCTTVGCSGEIARKIKVQDNLQQASDEASLGNTAKAREAANAAIAVDPKSLDVYVSPGAEDEYDKRSIDAIFENTGDYQDRVDYLKEAAQKFPNDYEPLLQLAEVQGLMGDDADKKANAAQAAAIIEKKFTTPGAKTNAALSVDLGLAYWDAGDSLKGEESFRRAISAYPGEPSAYNGLAYEFAEANLEPKLAEARSLADRALTIVEKDDQVDPVSLANVQDTVGWVHYRRGEYKEALDALTEAIDNAPRQPVIRYHVAMVYLALKDVASARAELAHALLLSKDYADAKTGLARLPTAQ